MFEISKVEKLMQDSYNHAIKVFSSLRVGAVSANFLDEIEVDVYNSAMMLKQVATVSVTDNFTLSVLPFDKSTLKNIMKAIQEANLGVGISTDNNNIKVTMPKITEERRKEMVKILKGYLEDSKVSIRNVRRDAMESVKKMQKDSIISEDQAKRNENEIQKLTDKTISEIEKQCHFQMDTPDRDCVAVTFHC